MFNPLKGLGDLKKMRDQALQMQKMLASEKITVEQDGVRVVMSGDQKLLELVIDGQSDHRISRAIQKAIEESQKVAAQKLASMSGGLGGLLGQ